MVINKNESVVEILGPDYPLYYSDTREIPNLLNSYAIVQAWKYLESVKESMTSKQDFADDLQLTEVWQACKDYINRKNKATDRLLK